MSAAPLVAVVGRLSRDPEFRHARNGDATTTAGVVVRSGGETTVVEVVAFKWRAEALAELEKGTRVVLAGEMVPRTWTDAGGLRHTATRLVASAIGVDVTPERRDIPATPGNPREGGIHG